MTNAELAAKIAEKIWEKKGVGCLSSAVSKEWAIKTILAELSSLEMPKEVRELVEELRFLEWCDVCLGECSTPEKEGDGVCRGCSEHERDGHAADCIVDKVFAAIREAYGDRNL